MLTLTLRAIPIHPYKKYEIDTPTKYESGYSETIGLLCPKCYHYELVDASSKYTINHIDSACFLFKTSPDLRVRPIQILDWVCPECGCDIRQYDHIDPNIVPIIALLNKKGFETEGCCEGHDYRMTSDYSNVSEEDMKEIDYSFPYIQFKTNKMRYITDILPLIHPWVRADKESDFTSFRIDVEQARLPERKVLGSLLLWAYYLPDITKCQTPEDINVAIEKAKPVYEWMQANPDKVTDIIDALYFMGIDSLDKECYDIAYKPYEYMPRVEEFFRG